MKKALYLIPLFMFAVTSTYAVDFSEIQTLKAADLQAAPEIVPVAPVPAVQVQEEQVSPDLVNRFNSAASQLRTIESNLTWVRMDIDNLERTARRMIQTNSSDAFFSMDLRRMSSDMSRRVSDLQRVSMDIKNLLGQAQKSKELNDIARNMEWAARDIQNEAWPTLENAAQNLEWTIRSGKPQVIGYDAQWTAMDISRYTRDFSYQARSLSFDVQSLVTKTQP
jgi:hypothetical protein